MHYAAEPTFKLRASEDSELSELSIDARSAPCVQLVEVKLKDDQRDDTYDACNLRVKHEKRSYKTAYIVLSCPLHIHLSLDCAVQVDIRQIGFMTVVTLAPGIKLQNLLPVEATFVCWTNIAGTLQKGPEHKTKPG